MPYSTHLLWQALLAAMFMNLLVGAIQGIDTSLRVTELLVSFGFFSLVVGCLLIARGLQARMVQTFAALFGVSVVMHVAVLLLLLLHAMQLPDSALRLLAYALLVWSIAVDGFILTGALNVKRAVGFGAALLIFVAQIVFVSSVVGVN